MSERQKILYVANMRLPSEKAHSVHVMEMCAALGATANVTLVLPKRKTHIKEDAFHYYGVVKTFNVEQLPAWDLIRRIISFFSPTLGYLLQTWRFSRLVAAFVQKHPTAMILSRDLHVAYRLAKMKKIVAFEVHDLPRRRIGWMIRAIPRIVTTNEWKANQLESIFGIDRKKIVVAPNAVDISKFHLDQNLVSSLRENAGLSSETRLIVYAGHLYPWKGVETLARATKYFEQLGIDKTKVLIVGGTRQDQERFSRLIEEEKLPVRLLPHEAHAHMPKLFALASVLVLPTSAKYPIGREQTSPLKAFEYLAAGRPIIVSDVLSSREIFTDRTAIFFRPDSPKFCANAIKKALLMSEEEREDMSSAQFEYVKERTWEARAKTVLDFLTA